MRQILHFEGTELEQDVPEEVANWLADLSLLRGVPLRYLVPHAALLPPESVCFFHVDPNWIRALRQGALSVGRQTAADREVDGCFHRVMCTRASTGALRTRSRRMHRNHRRIESPHKTDGEARFSGFLMRSVLIRHWKGVEVLGFSRQGDDCDIARMEQIGNSLLLCIFTGEIEKVVLNEPSEALHFGIKDGTISIRAITGKVGADTGKVLPVPVTKSGRVQVWDLVGSIAKEGLGVSRESITSAELALQLLTVADRCEFQQTEEPRTL